jgi:hypothetical protein
VTDNQNDRQKPSLNFNDVLGQVDDMSGAFTDAARKTDVLGPTVDAGLEIVERAARVAGHVDIFREGYDLAAGPSGRLDQGCCQSSRFGRYPPVFLKEELREGLGFMFNRRRGARRARTLMSYILLSSGIL